MNDNHKQPANPLYQIDKQEACGLSKLEYACIHLRIPETGDPVLDALIEKAQRRDLAAIQMGTRNEESAIERSDDLLEALSASPSGERKEGEV